jgi:hypothetical protein
LRRNKHREKGLLRRSKNKEHFIHRGTEFRAKGRVFRGFFKSRRATPGRLLSSYHQQPEQLDKIPESPMDNGGNFPVKKLALTLLLALSLAPAAAIAQVGVVVRVAPPAPVVEHYGPPPHPGWVWQPGYQAWDGNRYAWHAGVWVAPPHPGARWVAHRWVHHNGGWVMQEGHWR